MKTSSLETKFYWQTVAAEMPEPQQQVEFIPGRKFKADFLWPDIGPVVEVDGGEWVKGRHNRGNGRSLDCERDALAILNGYTVVRLTGTMVKNGSGIKLVQQVYDYLLA